MQVLVALLGGAGSGADAAALTDATFKTASWDYVQNTITAASKWGDIGDWDTSGVGDFSYAFSQDRDATGGSSFKVGGNPKAAMFVGTDISKWITSSVTSLFNTFSKAGGMNADLSGWFVEKVTTMQGTFNGASKFVGTGLDSWITTSVTTLYSTFEGAAEMNADLSGWSIFKSGSLVTPT